MNNPPLIIGITGAFGSGKTTVSQYLNKKSFIKLTLSSFLEEEARKRNHTNITRKILQDIGNEWREKKGPGVLVKKALNEVKVNFDTKIVIDGIRNIGEIEELRLSSKRFKLLGIIADRRIRFERIKESKKREGLSWEQFEKLDYRDLGVNESVKGLQVALCTMLSDVFILNNGTIEDFYKKIDEFLKIAK